MYQAFKESDGLEQGDVCRGIPITLLADDNQWFDMKTQNRVGPMSPATLSTSSNLGVLHVARRVPVVVLSQSCDLADVERTASGRILVAPVVADDDDRFCALYEKAKKEAADALVKKMMAKTPPADAAQKAAGAMDASRSKALQRLWLGEIVGAFPLAGQGELQRSICYFDNVISLPASWLALLKSNRILRLAPEWANELRQALMLWLGRTAFPGDREQRLAAGGLGTAPPVDDKPPEK